MLDPYVYADDDNALTRAQRPHSIGVMRDRGLRAISGPEGTYGVVGVAPGVTNTIGIVEGTFREAVETIETLFTTSDATYLDFTVELRTVLA